jgi:hypothetical protein
VGLRHGEGEVDDLETLQRVRADREDHYGLPRGWIVEETFVEGEVFNGLGWDFGHGITPRGCEIAGRQP